MKRLALVVIVVGVTIFGIVVLEQSHRDAVVTQARDNERRDLTVARQFILKNIMNAQKPTLPNPEAAEDLNEYLMRLKIIDSEFVDGWGHPFKLYITNDNGFIRMSSISAGRDGRFDTTDDMLFKFSILQ